MIYSFWIWKMSDIEIESNGRENIGFKSLQKRAETEDV